MRIYVVIVIRVLLYNLSEKQNKQQPQLTLVCQEFYAKLFSNERAICFTLIKYIK